MRAFIAAVTAMADADRFVRAINEEEVRLVRMAGAPSGVHVPEIRAAFARLRRMHSGRDDRCVAVAPLQRAGN
jgi:hypothetical protein